MTEREKEKWHAVWEDGRDSPALPIAEEKIEFVIMCRGLDARPFELMGSGFRDSVTTVWDLSRHRRIPGARLVRWRYLKVKLTERELEEPT